MSKDHAQVVDGSERKKRLTDSKKRLMDPKKRLVDIMSRPQHSTHWIEEEKKEF